MGAGRIGLFEMVLHWPSIALATVSRRYTLKGADDRYKELVGADDRFLVLKGSADTYPTVEGS